MNSNMISSYAVATPVMHNNIYSHKRKLIKVSIYMEFISDAQRAQDSLEGGVEKLENAVENLNLRLARLLAEYSASQAKLKQRIAKLEIR